MNISSRAAMRLGDTLDFLVRRAQEPEPSFRLLVDVTDLDPAQDFIGTSLIDVDFREQDLRGFNFDNADLTGADFRRSDVTGVSFQGANLTGTIGLPEEIGNSLFEYPRAVRLIDILKVAISSRSRITSVLATDEVIWQYRRMALEFLSALFKLLPAHSSIEIEMDRDTRSKIHSLNITIYDGKPNPLKALRWLFTSSRNRTQPKFNGRVQSIIHNTISNFPINLEYIGITVSLSTSDALYPRGLVSAYLEFRDFFDERDRAVPLTDFAEIGSTDR
jgi:hypothetical protein